MGHARIWEKRGPSKGNNQFKGRIFLTCCRAARKSTGQEGSQQLRVINESREADAGDGEEEWVELLDNSKDFDFYSERSESHWRV